jgi:hypothetical protein
LYRAKFPVKEILIPACLGIPISLLAYTISLTAILNSGNEFVEVNRFNAISLLGYGIYTSIVASFVFSSLPFVTLFLFRVVGVLDAKTSRVLSIGLVTFGCFDCVHDAVLVSTVSDNPLLTFFAPLGISFGIGLALWVAAKKFIFANKIL